MSENPEKEVVAETKEAVQKYKPNKTRNLYCDCGRNFYLTDADSIVCYECVYERHERLIEWLLQGKRGFWMLRACVEEQKKLNAQRKLENPELEKNAPTAVQEGKTRKKRTSKPVVQEQKPESLPDVDN